MFPPEIHDRLQNYVYKLIDPRDGSIFYIGRGVGNRVFQHVRDELKVNPRDDEDGVSKKLKTIREIRNAALEPLHIIHRHGMTLQEAKLVEAVLIDATPGLTNEIGGEGSTDFGPAHAEELIRRYSMPEFERDLGQNLMLINVRRSVKERSLYDGVRLAWRINQKKAEQADFILAVSQGVCLDAFIADRWMPATVENFPGRLEDDVPGRIGFVGRLAPDAIRERYRHKRLPEDMRARKGMASPVRYFY